MEIFENNMVRVNVDDWPGLIVGNGQAAVGSMKYLMPVTVRKDENGVPYVDMQMTCGGGEEFYDFVFGEASNTLKAHGIPGVWHCCVIDADIIDPVVFRYVDTLTLCAVLADTGKDVCAKIGKANLLCMVGRDKIGLCGCGGLGGRVDK